MIEDKNPYTTPISSLGEFGLIKKLTEQFSLQNTSSILGIGDDAAIIDNSDMQTVVSSDMLVENVHFKLGYSPLKHLGYKSVIVNLSDIAAMNAVPKQILVNIAVSNRFPVEALEEIYAGIHLACKKYGVDLIGGDTTSSTSGLIISITALGEIEKNKFITRKSAKDKDLIVVSGDLGAAYCGLQVLERENIAFKSNPNLQPDLSSYSYIIERQLKPEARTDVRKILAENGISPTSMIDISDGLASETLHLANQSGLGFHIYEDKIPIDPSVISTCEEFNISPTTAALNGGEDYEILFTIPISDFEKINKLQDFTVIGYTSETNKNSTLILSGSEKEIPLTAQGWEAFG